MLFTGKTRVAQEYVGFAIEITGPLDRRKAVATVCDYNHQIRDKFERHYGPGQENEFTIKQDMISIIKGAVE